MALYYLGILGTFKNKVGTVVGRHWKNWKWTMAAYVRNVKNPRTEAQQFQRARFAAIGGMCSAFLPAIAIGFRKLARQLTLTEGNVFVKMNIGAVEATTPDSVTIDYSAIQVAKGRLPEVQFGSPLFDTPLTVEVSYTPHTDDPEADAADTVLLFVYNPEDGRGILSEGAARSAGSASVTVPGSWNGVKVHVWGFVTDDKGLCSRSTYIGSGNIS